jgi:hypothetical protein
LNRLEAPDPASVKTDTKHNSPGGVHFEKALTLEADIVASVHPFWAIECFPLVSHDIG